MPAIHKLLVANRGEIACRVIETARAKGFRTVAVFSDADAGARHVGLAHEAIRIGPAPVAQSYLDIDRILAAAARTGADAVHPGYGFLSERAAFAEACAAAGLVFVGPSAEAIRTMGDKATSKRRMIEADVPCVPGYQGVAQDDATLLDEAGRIGFPIMVKASAGGGGRGMRLVHAAGDMPAALQSARSEARTAFGDDTLLLERAIIDPRHVEIQVFGDTHGNVIHLGERDCSIQRRHQKIIEEAPSPAVDPALRARMGEAAVRAAQAINYVGAGTVEFLLAPDGEFYFMEMNTRLQVEHPVTELVIGLDLVALQLDVAQGMPLPIGQEDVRLNGHAIEARLYAEDAEGGFLPQTGDISIWRPASGAGVRIDHGLREGGTVSPFYDPMLAKIIAWGGDREEARRRLAGAIADTRIHGVVTNRGFLSATLRHPAFAAGEATTAFVGTYFGDGFEAPAAPAWAGALAAVLLCQGRGAGWSSNGLAASNLLIAGPVGEGSWRVQRDGGQWTVSHDGETVSLTLLDIDGERVVAELDGHMFPVAWHRAGADAVELDIDAQIYRYADRTLARRGASEEEGSGGEVRAPMNGAVGIVSVEAGAAVTRGQLLMVVEAMKMEHQIVAPVDGVVETVAVVTGGQVATRDLLVLINAAEAE